MAYRSYVGDYWVQPVALLPGLVVLDVSVPKEPVEVSRLKIDHGGYAMVSGRLVPKQEQVKIQMHHSASLRSRKGTPGRCTFFSGPWELLSFEGSVSRREYFLRVALHRQTYFGNGNKAAWLKASAAITI